MSIKNSKPSSKSRFKQGYFNPSNPQKYMGDLSNIIYRSSWELRWMNYCDTNNAVLEWASEPIQIPYFNSIVDKVQNYYVDFLIKLQTEEGVKIKIVEIKPKAQLPEEYGGKKPILEGERWTLKKAKTYNAQLRTYITNKEKFKAARSFAEERGWVFAIVTEDDLFRN